MPVKQEKTILRLKIRQLKKKISPLREKESSISIFKEIEKLDVFKNSKSILFFWSMEHEVLTHNFVIRWSKEKRILLPVTLPDRLQLKEFTGKQFMRKSSDFPVYEPEGGIYKSIEDIDLAIVPGVAFDKMNNRLGFGKGYYDKLLPEMKAYKIGVCFDFQFFDEIPYDNYDVKMDLVIAK